MIDGQIESTRYLRNPLDVLAQQIVAHVSARGDTPVAELSALVRRAANFADLSDDQLTNTLDLLAGRYPSEEFSELRPRVVWNRVDDTVRARDGSKRLAVTSGGTIPDRGLFGVFLPDGTRVGELDEEMVYESRPGETFILGASTWRIEDITFQKVTVTPAPGQPGKMPFWHGDRPGRPLELGRALGGFVRELRELPAAAADERLRTEYALDELAASNLLQYVQEQAEATGSVPDDRTVVIERFRDEIGDWRICLLSPFGTPVHAPWAMAIERRLADQYDMPVESMWGDDGIVLRLPEAADALPVEAMLIDPEDIEELVVSTLPQTALFSSRFRECAGRALLLPRRRPDQRTPLWQQRQRAADLLAVAAKYPTFPILLEASRECLQDVFDVPALKEVLGQLRSRAVRVVTVDTPKPSPMAQSLLFNWIAAYMYEGDAPLAERRAAALALDRDLLRDLLGAEELRELLDPGVLADVELDLQRLSEGRQARTADELHDVLRRVGDLSLTDLDLRSARSDRPDAADPSVQNGWIAELLAEKRAIELVDRGRVALRRRRGRRPLPRRAGLRHPDGVAAGVHRARAAAVGGAGGALRPHPRAVRRAGGRGPLRPRRVPGGRRAAGAGGRGPPGAGRVPPRGRAPGVVRQRGAPPAPPALAGRPAQGGRAGRDRGVGPVPPGLARGAGAARRGRTRGALGRRRGRRGPRPAGRGPDRRLDARRRRPRGAGPGLPARAARRAVHVGRCRLGRRRRDRQQRRPGPPVLRRPARAPGAELGGAGAPRRQAARCPADRAGRARRRVLEPAAGRRARVGRRRAADRAVGPRVGGRGHQRLAGPAAGRRRSRSAGRRRGRPSGPGRCAPSPAPAG